jgi:hypothetical protein
MTTVIFNKCVDILNDVNIPYSIKHSDLPNENLGNTVSFLFAKCEFNRRIKQIENLGYTLVEWVWKPDENSEPFDRYKGTFSKTNK